MAKKIISNYRYWLLLIIGFVATIGTFSVPEDGLPLLSWLWVLISTKVIGLGAFYLFYVLVERWEKRGTIPELTQFTKEF
ncbi:hypothetical protein [Bacteroides acidifaciens]|uniref:Uncharacterized protein n=1 Tax=Bacteroides acidifaciens TaxID=85831 RepID=A0A4S2AZM4_9BACE|nr:hypothetical protein [Bacteroides acidifaciens]TGY07108.1 hypothetical protein E5356_05110 [Bacteroides acidifaciens]